ncbi:MAG: oligosaccharide flippase family protein [Treponemataceae bacterium]
MTKKIKNTATKPKSLVLNSTLNIIRTVMGVIFPLITFPYVSRILGPAGTGKVAYANSIVSYFVLLAELGITGYAIREGAKIRNDKYAFSKFCKEMLIINFSATIFAYILLFVVLFCIPQLYEYRTLILALSSTILFTTLGVEWVYVAVEDFTYITIRSIAFMIFGLVLLFVLVRKPEDIFQYALISVLTNVGANIFNFIHARKHVDFALKIKPELKKHLKPIFLIFTNVITISIYNVLDTTLVGAICADYEVGIYNAALKVNRLVFALIVSFSDVITPRMSNTVENDSVQYKKLLNNIFNLNLILSIPSMVGLIYLAEPITLFLCGSQFLDSIPSMRLMTAIIVIIPLASSIAGCIFSVNRKDTYNLIPAIGSAILNLILNLILIPKYGAFGAGIGTISAEFIGLFIRIILVEKMYKEFYKTFSLIYQYLFAATVMLGVLILFNRFIPVKSALIMFVDVFIGALFYGLILVFFKNKYILDAINFVKNKIHKK